MISFVWLALKNKEFEVTEVYYDKGGVKAVSSSGEEYEVSWAKTLKEVQESQNDSMYKGGMFVDLKNEEIKGLIGMKLEDFNNKYGGREIGL